MPMAQGFWAILPTFPAPLSCHFLWMNGSGSYSFSSAFLDGAKSNQSGIRRLASQ